jgi:hypothetical protein
MYQKLKSFLQDDLIFISLLLCLVAIVAFLLGQASVAKPGIAVVPEATIRQLQGGAVGSARLPAAGAVLATSSPVLVPAASADTSGEKNYVASKSGTKYHLSTCSGAKLIKEENKLFFATKDEAESAGYSKAANCPGL